MKKNKLFLSLFCVLCVGCGPNSGGSGNQNQASSMSQEDMDQSISQEAMESIKYDKRISITTKNHLEIFTENGVVTVCGTLMVPEERGYIIEDIHSVKGVKRVKVQLQLINTAQPQNS